MKRLAFILFVSFSIASCGGKKSDNPNPGGGNQTPPAPIQATLSLPAQNAACTTGTVLSTTQSAVNFSWTASQNTDNYEIEIKNLLDNTIVTQTTSQTQLTVTLLRGTPYSWYIISKSSKTTVTAQSDTWKFYNAGPGILSYAPFPAELTSPTFGQAVTTPSGTINLTWVGSSVDNAVTLTYDVYFDTNSLPALSKSGVTDMFLNNIPVTSGKTYYWKIVTKDSNGNGSDSGVSQFSVQ